MDDIYKSNEEYKPNKKRKILKELLICLVIKNLIQQLLNYLLEVEN